MIVSNDLNGFDYASKSWIDMLQKKITYDIIMSSCLNTMSSKNKRVHCKLGHNNENYHRQFIERCPTH